MTTELEAFEAHRELLFGIAYRMLGSAADADDILQEARLRWAKDGVAESARQPRAFLVTVVTRLCLDQLKSARVRREVYPGPWLPEPIVTGPDADPSTISTAFLLVLERLGPAERAAFLLHDVFDYDHAEIARVLERSEEACRQLVSRARRRVAEERPRPPASREEHARLLAAFAAACATGDVATLERLLAADVTVHNDAGGRANAARKIVHGRDRAARFLLGVRRFYDGFDVRPFQLNGLPALVLYVDGAPHATLAIDAADGEILAVHSTLNPDKLARLS